MLTRDFPTFARLVPYMIAGRVPHFPLTASFDVTNKCTLHCKHCYWRTQGKVPELEGKVYLKKVTEIKKRHPTLVSAVWMGGEPLLRPELVARGKSHFSLNEVITNGTLPLPNWRDVRFACSVDGTKEFHELQRGKNTYDQIKKNIDREELNVNIACVLTKINESCLEEFVEEWRQTSIRSMGFAFYTPTTGHFKKDLWLDFKERDQVLDRLLELKSIHPRFVNSSKVMLSSFRSNRCLEATEKCRRDIAPFNGMSFDATLRRKLPCVIGKDADCDRCGCPVVGLGEAWTSRDFSWAVEHLRTQFSPHKARA